MKPHIRKVQDHWEIYSDRASRAPIGLARTIRKLAKIGPWRNPEITIWFGDAKKST